MVEIRHTSIAPGKLNVKFILLKNNTDYDDDKNPGGFDYRNES